MIKRLFVYLLIGSMCTVPTWGQAARTVTQAVRQGFRAQPLMRTRVHGAKPSTYLEKNDPQARWQQTYLLNNKYLDDVAMQRVNAINYQTTAIRTAVSNLPKPTNTFQAALQRPHFNGEWQLQKEQLELVNQNYQKRLAWLQAQPNQGMDRLGRYAGRDSGHVLALKLQNENLIFVGEYHDQPALRTAFADWVEQLHRLEPNRKIVVFAESLYLDPLAKEDVYPTTYYRRGEDGVQAPVDIRDEENPALTFMHIHPSYKQMLERLTQLGADIYPVEDAVVGQKQLMGGEMAVMHGLKERNSGFARVMRAQMERIRQTDPQALFIYYGGALHVSWAYPASLPKMFADEFPVVVEMTIPQTVRQSHSVLSGAWPVSHPFFDETGPSRFFYWKGDPEIARVWGQQTGFDYTVVVAP